MRLMCKACNRTLSAYDYNSKKSDNLPEEEDLCSGCLSFVLMEDDLDVREYQHEHLTEEWYNFRKYSE